MDALLYILDSVVVIMIIFAWFKIATLRKRIPGGLVRAICNVLSEFIGLFALGFLTLSLFPLLPEASRGITLSLVFMCAAAFSVVIINFFGAIAAEAGF